MRYVQRAVHDFAFVAGRALLDRTIRYDVPGDGPPVDIRYLVPKGTEHQLPRWRRAIEGSLEVLGRRVGPYPYGTLTVVCPPFAQGRSGGMEYPTLITGLFSDPLWDRFPLASVRLPELVLVHEFGHQYFYGLLASNEREEAFLDEGFNSYWESEILREVYGNEAGGSVLGRRVDLGDRRTTLLAQSTSDIRESVRKRPSWLFYPRTWASQIYDRSAVTLRTAAQLYGQDVIDAVFAAYFRAYAFHHPGLEDFLAVAHERGGAGLAGFLHEAFTRPEVPDYRVAMASAERWESPLGRVRGVDGPRLITEENRDPHGEIALDPTAREEDGRLLIEVTDPGWVGPSEDRRGSVTRRMVTPRWGDATSESDDEEAYFESRVRLEGPAWEHLPVSVLFRFSDGALVRDEWDGRAAWRAYRFLRGSPLAEVQIDPEKRIALDVRPENNARSVATDRGFALAWGLWFLALAGWWIGGLALWI